MIYHYNKNKIYKQADRRGSASPELNPIESVVKAKKSRRDIDKQRSKHSAALKFSITLVSVYTRQLKRFFARSHQVADK